MPADKDRQGEYKQGQSNKILRLRGPSRSGNRLSRVSTSSIGAESGRAASAGWSASRIERPTAAAGRAAGAELLEREFLAAGLDGLLATLEASAWARPRYAPAAKARLREMRRGGAGLAELLEFLATDPTTVGWSGIGEGSSNMECEDLY